MFSALPRVLKGKSTDMGFGVCGTSFTTDKCLRFECIVTTDKGVTVNLEAWHVAQGAGYGCLKGKHGVILFIPSVLSFQIISVHPP